MSILVDLTTEDLKALYDSGSPPCDGLVRWKNWGACGSPSHRRIAFTCHHCGTAATLFLCEYCFRWLRTGRAFCDSCSHAHFSWEYR